MRSNLDVNIHLSINHGDSTIDNRTKNTAVFMSIAAAGGSAAGGAQRILTSSCRDDEGTYGIDVKGVRFGHIIFTCLW